MPADRYIAGFGDMRLGINMGENPSLLPAQQAALGQNVSLRGGFVSTRQPWTQRPLNLQGNALTTWTGRFQGHCAYNDGQGKVGWVVSRGGHLFFAEAATWLVTDITPIELVTVSLPFTVPALNGQVDVHVSDASIFSAGDMLVMDSGSYTILTVGADQFLVQYTGGAANATVAVGTSVLRNGAVTQVIQANPTDLDLVYLFQAENYVIILAGQHATIIWDGTMARRALVKEVPPGFIGTYGWGRIWVALPNRSQFVAGDIVGGASGTVQKGFRDAILKFTENDIINEGGAFAVPYNAGPITAMQFLATQDTSLGVGVLVVGTTNMVFSVNAPVDRTIWKNLNYPIQTVSLIDYGPASPGATVPVEGDIWYRSAAGIQSFIVARRNFPSAGNTPSSFEVSPILAQDDDRLLLYGSGLYFDNRLFMTVSPSYTPGGITHRGLLSINFDLISTLVGKDSPAWEGHSVGLSFLQLSKVTIDGQERGFAFVLGTNDVQLWEIENDSELLHDRVVAQDGSITQVPIACALESRADNFGSPGQLKKLFLGAIYLDDIAGQVTFTVSWKPDQWPSWIFWKSFIVCAANVQACTVNPLGLPGCSVWKPFARLYAPRILLPRPPDGCVEGMILPLPARLFHEAQFRFEWQGHVRIRRFEAHAKVQPQPTDGTCPDTLSCVAFQDCGTNLFPYLIPS